MFARTPGTFAVPPPAGAASPTVALPWGGSSTDRATLPPPASAVWSRFHDGGSLSSVSRVEAKELTERVAHLERDRGVLVAELQAAQQVRADWEAALSAAEAKVLHERGEHAAAVALLRTQLAGARAELEAVRGELVQAQRTAQAARSEAEQAVGPEVAALQARCATAEAASAAAQSAARALRAERDEAVSAAAAALRDKHVAESALRAIHDNITAREQLADARAADAAQRMADAEAKCAAAAAESAAAAAATAAAASLQTGAVEVAANLQSGRRALSAQQGQPGPSRRARPAPEPAVQMEVAPLPPPPPAETPLADAPPMAPAPTASGRRQAPSRGRAASASAQALAAEAPPQATAGQQPATTEVTARRGRSGAVAGADTGAEGGRKRMQADVDDKSEDSV